MSVLDIVTYPAPVLLTPAPEVAADEFGPDLQKFANDMAETMYVSNGIGLAAPQVSVSKRMLVMDVEWPDREDSRLYVLVNPVLEEGRGETVFEEGCLSFPGLAVPVDRFEEVTVRAQDALGRSFRFDADGILSICFQHELDHLDGVTLADRATGEAREQLFAEIRAQPWFRPELLPDSGAEIEGR